MGNTIPNTQYPREKRFFQLLFLMFVQLRPKQWSKNVFIVAPLLFSDLRFDLPTLALSLSGFLLFSLISGVVYILNDFHDINEDRLHPKKKYRPMASGKLSPIIAIPFGIVLAILVIALSFYLNLFFGISVVVYLIVNILYSYVLKNVVIVDVFIIAFGFVIRFIAGSLLIGVPMTAWFILCSMLLSLFLALGKRRHEFLMSEGKGNTRRVLTDYSAGFLDQLISIVTTATIITYSLFTFNSGRTIYLMATIPIVIYGIFRYLFLIYVREKGGSPEKDLLGDSHILGTAIVFFISVITILTIFE